MNRRRLDAVPAVFLLMGTFILLYRSEYSLIFTEFFIAYN